MNSRLRGVSLDTGALKRLSAVARELGVVPRTVNRWLDDASLDFPRPVIIKGRYFYNSREIEDWCARQAVRTDVATSFLGPRADRDGSDQELAA